MKLKNKIAIITGGSRGIGFATADRFLAEGATVIITASSPATAEKGVAALRARHPEGTVEGISPNLADTASVRAAFDAVAEKYGRIDILVNNAGVSESTPFTAYTEELYDKALEDENLDDVKAVLESFGL